MAFGIWISFAAFWLVQVWIILNGLEGIKKLEGWSAPLLLAGGALLLGWAIVRGGGLGHILAQSSRLQQRSVPFWQLFPAAVTANVGYWATLSLNIPDFTRYARSQRSQVLGQALGLPATMTAFAFIGVAVTSATIVLFGEAIWDPVVLIARIGNPVVVDVRRAHHHAGAIDDEHGGERRVAGERFLEPRAEEDQLRYGRSHHCRHRRPDDAVEAVRRRGGLHFHVVDRVSSLMGAIGGILIADYWIIRKKELSLEDLFKVHGRYTYTGGVNRRAMAILDSLDPAGCAGVRSCGADAWRAGCTTRTSGMRSTRMPGLLPSV